MEQGFTETFHVHLFLFHLVNGFFVCSVLPIFLPVCISRILLPIAHIVEVINYTLPFTLTPSASKLPHDRGIGCLARRINKAFELWTSLSWLHCISKRWRDCKSSDCWHLLLYQATSKSDLAVNLLLCCPKQEEATDVYRAKVFSLWQMVAWARGRWGKKATSTLSG